MRDKAVGTTSLSASRRTSDGRRTRQRSLLAPVGCCLFAAAVLAVPKASLGEPPAPEAGAFGERRDESDSSAMRVYIDPKTGKFAEPPQPTANRRSAPSAVPAPPPPAPVPFEGPTEGGGEMIDGRGFQAEMRSIVTPDGKVSTGCDHAGTPAVEDK